jgi:hypothetical protein
LTTTSSGFCDQPLFLLGEVDVAQRHFLLEEIEALLEELELFLVLRLVGLPHHQLELFHPALRDAVVGQDELGFHRGDVASRVEGTLDVWDGLVRESANDVGERAGGAQLIQRQGTGGLALFHTGQVEILDGSRRGLLRLVHPAERPDARVRNLGDADLGFAPGAVGRRCRAGGKPKSPIFMGAP